MFENIADIIPSEFTTRMKGESDTILVFIPMPMGMLELIRESDSGTGKRDFFLGKNSIAKVYEF